MKNARLVAASLALLAALENFLDAWTQTHAAIGKACSWRPSCHDCGEPSDPDGLSCDPEGHPLCQGCGSVYGS